MRAAGWYADPTGRHEWRYWRPGWTDLAADGRTEVDDPLRPRWRRYLGITLVAQLVLVPILGIVWIHESEKPDARFGVVQQGNQHPPVASIVYAPCPGERIRHIALSKSGGKGSLSEVIWSAVGDGPANQPIKVGEAPQGLTIKKQLRGSIGASEKLILLVSTDQLTKPNTLTFSMDEVPSSGVLSYHGTYRDVDTFNAAAHDITPCGSQVNTSRGVLAKIIIAEVLLSLVGVALLVLPRYKGPASQYA